MTTKNTSTNTTIKPVNKKKRWFRYLFEVLLIVSIVFGIRAWQQKDLVAGEAPSFQSVMLDGKTVNLEDYRGKPFILHFWASWCAFCKVEEGSMTKLQKDWPVLSVAYQSGDREEVLKHMKERNIDAWPTIVDKDNRLGDLFGVRGVPTSYVIDGKGNVRFAEVGLTSGWGMRARLWWVNKFKNKFW